jgi:hypothetical protein
MSLSKQEFTDAGRSMLGRAQAGETLTVSRIVVGSGGASTPDQLWPLTDLIAHEMDVTISSTRDYGNGTLLVEGSFRSDTAPAAFQLREVGVTARIGAEADRLYSVANVLATPPDTVDPGSPSLQAFKIKLVIDRIPAASLVIQIGPSENVIGQNLATDAEGPGVYKDAAGNVLSFKRLAAGTGIELLEDAAETFITIGAKVLKIDLDLYVPANHPNCPNANVGFPSVQAAHDFLLQYRIPAGRVARINVWSGTYVSAPINFIHPDSPQIQLLGWPRQEYPISTTVYISATSKRVTLVATPPVGALAAGMIVYLADSSGHSGGCRITAISGNVVTCSILHRGTQGAVAPYTATVNGGRLCRYPTVLECNDQNGQNFSFPNGLGLVNQVCFHKGCYGIGGGNAGVSNVMIIGMLGGTNRRGFTTGGSLQQIGGECVITDWDFGFTARSGGALWTRDKTYINACSSGFNPGGGGGAMAALVQGDVGQILYINHCGMGIQAYNGASASGGSILIGVCDKAVSCANNSVVTLGTGTDQWVLFYGNDIDIEAFGMSYVYNNKANGSGPNPAKCTPAPETTGNQNSLIHLV